MLKLVGIEYFRLIRPLPSPFVTSFASRLFISHVIVVCGWKEGVKSFESYGEATSHSEPYYNGEFDQTAMAYLGRVAPVLVGRDYESPEQLHFALDVAGMEKENRFPIAALDIAFHDAFAKSEDIPLSVYLSDHYGYGTSPLKEIGFGTSIGLKEDPQQLSDAVKSSLESGKRKIKMKIKPGSDIKFIGPVVETVAPEGTYFCADANSSYDYGEKDHFDAILTLAGKLDLIEQPFAFDDLWNHAKFASELATGNFKARLCLDESIRTAADFRSFTEMAAEISGLSLENISSKIALNIKLSRVGGLAPAMELARFCRDNGILIMPGNMHDFTVSAAATVAFSAIDPDFFPGDTEGEEKNYPAGAITVFEGKPYGGLISAGGNSLKVPDKPGLGIGELDKAGFKKINGKSYLLDRDVWDNAVLEKVKTDIAGQPW